MNARKRIGLGGVVVGILSMFAALLTGCGKQTEPVISPPTSQPGAFAEVASVPFPESTRLTGLYITHQGMRPGPYYILKTTEAGTYMKISDHSPDNYRMTKDEDTSGMPANARYFGFIDQVKDLEYASLVLLEDEAPLRELEAAIAECGALAWDGYDENDPMEGVLDSGDSYRLHLELSDGQTVTMKGYNVCPAGFQPLLMRVGEIFEANSDYSRYMAKGLTDSPCEKLFIKFSEGMYTEYRLELSSSGRWVVRLSDPYGSILDAKTEISGYGDTDDVPFNRFLEIMQNHGAEEWNGYYKTDPGFYGGFTLFLTFEDGKKFEASGSAFPEGFEQLRTDLVHEISRFYTEMKEGKQQ